MCDVWYYVGICFLRRYYQLVRSQELSSSKFRWLDFQDRRQIWRFGIILALLVVVGAIGVRMGNWLADSSAKSTRQREVDEYLGLGQRTGLTGELSLAVKSTRLVVYPGQPVAVELTLTNRSSKSLVLNDWFTPAPAVFESNQLPLKVNITRDGRRVPLHGSAVLYPPHTKKDFMKLRPGGSKSVKVELSGKDDIGKWDMSSPGTYTVDIWYETYLTGRYIGANAWTGMTNHVIVNVTVVPQKRDVR